MPGFFFSFLEFKDFFEPSSFHNSYLSIREINFSDAFIAAWLPGTEGNGITDLIFMNDEKYDFTGRLSFSWPKRPDQSTLNFDEKPYDPLFPIGYGLSYQDQRLIGKLDEEFTISEDSDFNAPKAHAYSKTVGVHDAFTGYVL